MPLKNKIFILSAFLFGLFLGIKIKPSQKPPEISQDQNQKNNQGQSQSGECVVSQKKITRPDGSIEEFFELKASQKQAQGQSQDQTQKQAIKIDSTPEGGLFLGGGINTDLKTKASIEAVIGSNSFEISSDLKKDHVFEYKKRVFEW